jgi:Ras-related protein Rab-11A
VQTEDAMAFAQQNRLAFIETSALDASGVDDAFRQILTEIFRLVDRKNTQQEAAGRGAALPKGSKVTISDANHGPKAGQASKPGCC